MTTPPTATRCSPGYTVGILLQEPALDESKTVLENVEEGVAEIKGKLDRFNEISALMAEPDADFDALLAEMGTLQEAARRRRRLGPRLPARAGHGRAALPAARRRRLRTSPAVNAAGSRSASCCFSKPDLLLLDEPTNHLDAESVLWLEQHLEEYPGAVVAVTHDRYFLDNVAQWISSSTAGRAYPYEGNYSTYLETKAARLKVEGQKDAKRKKRLQDELEWVRSNAKARQTKSKARLDRYEEMAAEADKHRKLDFEEIQIPPGPRLGGTVIEAEKLTKGFDDRMLIDDLSFSLPRNGIVGVIGPNGVGKTTLFKMIVGDEQPDGGELKVGETVKISYVDQGRGGLDPTRPCGRSSRTGSTTSRSAMSRCRPAPTSPPSASRARTSRSRPRCSPVVSATASTLP